MIYWYRRHKGTSPSLEEIQKFIRFANIGRVEHYLDEMDRRKWIIFNAGKHRAIILLPHKKLTEIEDEIDDFEIAKAIGFPRVEGTIAAGLPIDLYWLLSTSVRGSGHLGLHRQPLSRCQGVCWLLVTSVQKIGRCAKNITKEQPSRTGSMSHLLSCQ